MSANEKLTVQALKDHDKVQPNFSSTVRRQGSKNGCKVSLSSRRSHPSGDQASQRSDRNGRPPPKINFFKFVVATRAWHRLARKNSLHSEKVDRPVIKIENTYRTEPEEGKYFAPMRVENMMKETLERKLKTVKYTPDGCRIIATELTEEIKSKVKAMDFPRYKIVCNVCITENKRQGLEIVSRGVWNQDTDDYASYTYRNPTLIAVATVYGVYYE
ncbi:dynein light chain Tctex-type 5-B-like [Mercenaria mercenaria]|uniref:dynein light chain Tctex-type 5-B-like n=1 Tax=Mercenaria mercenaria TaxID=6596 RepID=UPI00234F4561|nr:dynein light chain Tctex-type 5-B-like [Mercenaria mercenaria]